MKGALLAQILLVGSLLLLSVPSNIFHVSAPPSYLPGVKQGDTTSYGNVSGTWHGNVTAAITLSGAGSTSVSPLINTLSTSYSQLDPNVQINYQAIGSGAGINTLIAKTTDFAASEAPLSNAQRAAAPNSLTIPDTIGAVAVVYNVPSLPSGLRMNATVIAEIFQGNITMWNDPAIAQLNPTLTLPSQVITVVHRADGSGTTFVFTGYLNTAAAGVWKLGQGTVLAWPVGLGAAGNQGVVGIVQGTPNTIGYVELNSALSNNMKLAYLRNAAGNFVQPTLASVTAAVSSSSLVLPQGNASWASVSLLNEPGTNSYPIVTFSYALVYQQLNVIPGMSVDKAKALANFLWYAIHGGQQRGVPLNYVPLPPGVVSVDEATVLSMKFNNFLLLESSTATPTATIAVQPHATIDLSRTMKQVTVEIALNNTPDIPPYNGISVQLSYDFRVLKASSLDHSTNVFTQTTLPASIFRDCLDGLPDNNGPTSLCGSSDGPGIVTFAETILGGLTPDGTEGNVFFLTFNVNVTSPSFSQIRFVSTVLASGNVRIPTTNLDGYYTSQSCGGQPCSPGTANFTWSPQPVKQRQLAIFDADASLPSPGGIITDYYWDFHDPQAVVAQVDTKTNSTATWSYYLTGNYSVTLTTTDSYGIRSSSTQTVNVVLLIAPPPNPGGAPPFIAEFLNVQSVQMLVQNVLGNSINASQTFTFNNGTSPRTVLLSGNVATGTGNLDFWILAGGLTTGSPIYNQLNSPTINSTDTEIFAGAPRQVVHLNILLSGGAAQMTLAWDQTTGVLLSFYANAFFQNGTNPNFGNATANITSTSLWSPVSFSISANPGNLNFFVNETSPPTSLITLTSHGFTGTVNLSANVQCECFGPVLNVSLIRTTLDLGLNGQNTTSLKPILSASTIPGIYQVFVTARAGILYETTGLFITVFPIGDFALLANPNIVTIQQSPVNPSAGGVTTITLTSLRGFSGNLLLGPLVSGPFDLSFAPCNCAYLPAGSSVNVSLTISAPSVALGTYMLNVTGTLTPDVNETVLLPPTVHVSPIIVRVISPPPDFQLYLSVPFGGNQIFAGSSTVIGVQVAGSGNDPFTGSVALSGQIFPLLNNGPALSFNPPSVSLQFGFASSLLTVSTTALTPPGNYTITITAIGGSVTHTAVLQLEVLPPPVITVNPSSGPVGTLVTVHGSGFIIPSQGSFFVPVEIQMTFDNQLVGFFIVQGSTFNFTFNVPIAQTGSHLIHAVITYPISLDVQTSFSVISSPDNLTVTVSSGTIYFRGDTATIFAVTSLNGQQATVTNLQVILVMPNGSNVTLQTVLVSPGVYKSIFAISTTGSLGTYGAIVKAHQTGASDARALTSFEVKPTWLQSNSKNLATASVIGAVGTLGIVALAWNRGYFGKRKDGLMVYQEPGN